LVEEAKLNGDDSAESNEFGYSVSLSGNRALIGAYLDDDNGASSGSAYIFAFDGSVWTQEAKLVADDGGVRDKFGISVSISGDRALIGASGQNNNVPSINSPGSAYVFAFDGTDWVQEAKFTASTPEASDQFGVSVSLSGDRALVGASGENNSTGIAYVFAFDGTTWAEETKLTASDAAENDQFGLSVSLSDSYALVGAPFESERVGRFAPGAGYIFAFDGTAWTQESKLTANDASARDRLGTSVSISDNRALVGASGENSSSGSAYVFVSNGTDWTQEAKLVANDAEDFDDFGSSVSLSGTRALVGARFTDDTGDASGSAYTFILENRAWTQESKLTAPNAAASGLFGSSVSLTSNGALIGASGENSFTGSAYVFPLDSSPVATDVEPVGLATLTVFPNPVSGHGTATFELAEVSDVSVGLYDALGRQVAQLADAPYAAGRHSLALATAELPTGVYVVRAQLGDTVRSTRLTIVR